ncbi:MAG: 50S ribosomal protein L32 [Syntrophobacterales bacterium]|nr:50S ribosomal protein L32 [Syntrophobacterales bacterium]
MPNPVKRHSKSRRNKRRAHDFITPPITSLCPQCKQPKLPHQACLSCGTYKGREVRSVEKAS